APTPRAGGGTVADRGSAAPAATSVRRPAWHSQGTPPLVGQRHSPRGSRQERASHPGFEVLHRGGHRRLGNIEQVGGAGDRALRRDLDEVVQLLQGDSPGFPSHSYRL